MYIVFDKLGADEHAQDDRRGEDMQGENIKEVVDLGRGREGEKG